MAIVDSMILTVKQSGVNFEGSPLDFLPYPFNFLKPVFNFHAVMENDVNMVFHDSDNNYQHVSVSNSLKIKAGDSSAVAFVTEPIPLDPTVDTWCQNPITLLSNFIEIIIKPVESKGKFRGLVALEISTCLRNDKYRRNKTVMDKGAIPVRGRYYDGIVIINGVMTWQGKQRI